jgi:hypothetical protein
MEEAWLAEVPLPPLMMQKILTQLGQLGPPALMKQKLPGRLYQLTPAALLSASAGEEP